MRKKTMEKFKNQKILQKHKNMLKLKGRNDTMELTIALALSIQSNKDIKGEIKCLIRYV